MKARTILTLGLVGFLGSSFGVTEVAALPILETQALQVCEHYPSVTAVDVTNGTTPDDPVGIANCPTLCNKWVAACKGAVDATRGCFSKALAKFGALQAALCKVQSGAARDLCNDDLRTIKANLKNQLDASTDTGHAYCETTGLLACNVNCS